jgi:hypothetical protein
MVNLRKNRSRVTPRVTLGSALVGFVPSGWLSSLPLPKRMGEAVRRIIEATDGHASINIPDSQRTARLKS